MLRERAEPDNEIEVGIRPSARLQCLWPGASARRVVGLIDPLIHAASGELSAGRVNDADAETTLVATILGAVTARPAAR